MANNQDGETRYLFDVELKSMKIIHWGVVVRENLKSPPVIHRIFLTLGQYKKYVSTVNK